MKFIYQGKSSKGGVYRILNTSNGRQYIGSTHRFKTRWTAHQKDLTNGNHHCKFLQRDFDKCGTDSFIFEIIEVVEILLEKKEAKEKRYDIEDATIKKAVEIFGREEVYNSYLDVRRREYKPNVIESRKHMSTLMTELYKDPERLKQASDFSKKRWEGHSANITVTNKNTGESVLIDKPLKTWCKERNIDYRAFHLMVRGKTKSSSGWFLGHAEPVYTSQKGQIRKPLSKEHRAKIAGSKYKGTAFVLPCGKEVVIGESVKDFCREHNLSYSTTTKYLKLIASST